MLPQSPLDVAHSTTKIYINPNFKQMTQPQSTKTTTTQTHINPLFLQSRRTLPSSVHLNPNFLHKNQLSEHELLERLKLQKQLQKQQQIQYELQMASGVSTAATPVSPIITTAVSTVSNTSAQAKIISKSNMRIVRNPFSQPITATRAPLPSELASPRAAKTALIPIKPISRKLVRRIAAPTTTHPAVSKAPKYEKTSSAVGKYKVDNRRIASNSYISHAHYALKRASVLLQLARKQKFSTLSPTKQHFNLSTQPADKKLQLLNINGVLYKSTRNKLQRKDIHKIVPTIQVKPKLQTSNAAASKMTSRCTLFVRGAKFIMNSQGYKLTRVPATSKSTVTPVKQPQRIDIGGLTYVASKTKNVYVCTQNHLALAHLNNAKQRSLQLLTKRYAKCNVPCAIFQRIGKCLAFERGKCNKVHDKEQVAICSRFLRSECNDPNCLLSHNVSLCKMPVCKFFLQGLCIRDDCPYLHKKLSQNAEICEDFLQGFCKLAAQCKKRHEFLCPDYERNGTCAKKNCIYCKTKRRQAERREKTKAKLKKAAEVKMSAKQSAQQAEQAATNTPAVRYFEHSTEQTASDVTIEPSGSDSAADDDISMATTSFHRRPKIGALPAFIPL